MTSCDISKLRFCDTVTCNDLQVARERVVNPILREAEDKGFCGQDQFAIRLGLEEAISNAWRHGNRCDPNKRIHVRWAVTDQVAVICVADEGGGFDPSCLPDPRAKENREKPSGRGVMLMRAFLTELRYNDHGNEVCLIKAKKPAHAADIRNTDANA